MGTEQKDVDRAIEGQVRLVSAAKEAHWWLGEFGYSSGIGAKRYAETIQRELRLALAAVGALEDDYPRPAQPQEAKEKTPA